MRAPWNFLAFQFGWFACVIGGANSVPWLGVAAVVSLAVGWALLLPFLTVIAGRFNGFEPDSLTRDPVSEAA